MPASSDEGTGPVLYHGQLGPLFDCRRSCDDGQVRGADRLAGEWAQERGIPVLACPIDSKRYGRAAATKRNRQMLAEKPDLVVAFPGDSDTRHMTLIAEDAGVKVIYPEDIPELWPANDPG